MRETELYEPVKAFLEAQGYDVKGEVGAADLVACRGGEDPVIVELKTGFSLQLFHQGIQRQKVTDWVYLAVPRSEGRAGLRALKENTGLARRLGLGLLTVRVRDGFVEAHCDPGAFAPRKVPARKSRLLREFAMRVGDPTTGGSTRKGLVTAYRQDALRCLAHLAQHGAGKGAAIARDTGVATATRILRDDHYGWFERVERGIYALTPKGREALSSYANELDRIRADVQGPDAS